MCVTIFKMRILARVQLQLTFLIKEPAQLQEELAFSLSLLLYPRLHWAKPSGLSLAAHIQPCRLC